MFNNLFLDRKNVADGSELVLSYPMAYFLEGGKYESKEAYKPTKKQNVRKKLTSLDVEKKVMDLGNVEMGQSYTDSIRIANVGSEELLISEIQASCECVQATTGKQEVTISGSTYLTVTFRPEDSGEFERYVYVYGNIQESPLEISIIGYVK